MLKNPSLFFVSILVCCTTIIYGQKINKVEIQTDTLTYNSIDHSIQHQGKEYLYFYYDTEVQIAEFKVWISEKPKRFQIIKSSDYELIDTILYIDNYYRFKVRFHDLTYSEFLRLSVLTDSGKVNNLNEVNLLPLHKTTASINIQDYELFIGEEKVFEVITNNPDNLRLQNTWTKDLNIDYRFSKKGGSILLHLIPNSLGVQSVNIKIKTRKPHLDEKGRLVYYIDPLKQAFIVKASRLRFLQLDEKEITLDETTRKEGIVIQLDNSKLFHMNKTYRIENQEKPGGTLIAELFTKQRLTNDKVLCLIRPYNFHRSSDGYLYIKDGDDAKFITNINVTPATTIKKISILHEGQEWHTTKDIYPGETFDIKIEGEGLHKAKFHFEDLLDVTRDTLVRNENQAIYRLKVPLDINKKSIAIFNNFEPTGEYLNVKEYQEPRDFDFIYLNYGDIGRRVSGLREPILYEGVIKDLTFNFNSTAIDKDKLYGKQYLKLDIKITGKKNDLTELRSIDNIVICPSDQSPRSEHYSSRDCYITSLSLNKYLQHKTYDLEDWSKISLTLKHDESKYRGKGFEQEIDIILKRRYSFDIEVSFPAGLITISKKDTAVDYSTLSGISMAMIAQFSFYHPEKIAKYRPYKIGAGFLAFNAFNFNENVSNRDVGLVVLGSLYPTTKDVKLTFPLYVGGGYFLKAQKFFFLVGPGIRVRL